MNDVFYLLAMDHGTLISTGVDTTAYFKKRVFPQSNRAAVKQQLMQMMRQYVDYETDIWLVDSRGRVLILMSCELQVKVYGE
jgi:hypothetical protein